MATYTATLMHGSRDAEADWRFEGPENLMKETPVRIMRTFMAWIDANAGLGHVDFELNAAMKSKDGAIVTALGNLVFHETDEQPFICMISDAA